MLNPGKVFISVKNPDASTSHELSVDGKPDSPIERGGGRMPHARQLSMHVGNIR